MANENITFLEEVDESLRVENAEKLLRRHGTKLIGLCIAIVLGTALSVFWKNHVREKNIQDTAIISDANIMIENGKYDDAVKKLGELSNPGRGSATVSKMMLAGTYISTGHPDKAEAVYNDIINESSSEASLRDLAVINIAILYSNRGAELKSDIAEKLKELYDHNREYASLAGELYAFNLQKTGKTKEAQDMLTAIADNPLLPTPERMNAKALVDIIKEKK